MIDTSFIESQALSDTLGMFVFLAAELTVLFLAISYLVGILQTYIPPEKIRELLSCRKGKGYILAAFLGAITPFCSCSTIPFLKGLLRAQAGFGTMMVFFLPVLCLIRSSLVCLRSLLVYRSQSSILPSQWASRSLLVTRWKSWALRNM